MSRIALGDDGSLDTVLKCIECGEEFRFNYQQSDVEDQQGVELSEQERKADYDDWVKSLINETEAEHVCGEED